MNPEGDNIGWSQLRGQLVRYLRKKSGDSALAEDLVQEVFLRYHGKRNQLRDVGNLRAWLFRVAGNLLVDHYRRKRENFPVTPEQTEEPDLTLACVPDCLGKALLSLPEMYRLALEQSELKNVPQVELATRQGLSYSALKSRIQRGRKLLREVLEEKYFLEADAYGNILRCEPRRREATCSNC